MLLEDSLDVLRLADNTVLLAMNDSCSKLYKCQII